jgi:hypothetical protein
MRIQYDSETNILLLVLRDDPPVNAIEEPGGVIVSTVRLTSRSKRGSFRYIAYNKTSYMCFARYDCCNWPEDGRPAAIGVERTRPWIRATLLPDSRRGR